MTWTERITTLYNQYNIPALNGDGIYDIEYHRPIGLMSVALQDVDICEQELDDMYVWRCKPMEHGTGLFHTFEARIGNVKIVLCVLTEADIGKHGAINVAMARREMIRKRRCEGVAA